MKKSTKNLIKTIREKGRELRILKAELNKIQRECKHQFPKPPYYYGFGKTPKGMTNHLDSETCILCGLDCHDSEEWK